MKPILIEIVSRLVDIGASLDALEFALVQNGGLPQDAIDNRYHIHKQIVEQHLAGLRAAIDLLPE